MSIPLDRLYHYIESIANDLHGDRVIIYHFYPHGSKKIEDLIQLEQVQQINVCPEIICYDQEPLNFDLYSNLQTSILENQKISNSKIFTKMFYTAVTEKLFEFSDRNLRYWIHNIYDKALLLHSEQQSSNVEKYQSNGFIPVYYWSHAVIARDWFRYAIHHEFKKTQVKKTFLIYNRAWTGTREYRLKFVELLHQHQLLDQCHTSLNFVDDNIELKDYKFINETWKPTGPLPDFLPTNLTSSSASADFVIQDYLDTEVEVVLETLFDDQRWHLTEKTLRPIACGQPFILAATAGSLGYLKKYGFKTFDTVWDESYDNILCPRDRLEKIVELMLEIKNWPSDLRIQKYQQAKEISEFNRKHFFSSEFSELVSTELKNNLKSALVELEETNTGKLYIENIEKAFLSPEIAKWVEQNNKSKTFNLLNTQARQKAESYNLHRSSLT